MRQLNHNFRILGFLLGVLFIISGYKTANNAGNKIKDGLEPFYTTVQKHKQLYSMSCIPSSVEMVLKYNKKVGTDYFQLQEAWKEKSDGNFSDFDGKTIAGLIFNHRFNQPRKSSFPIENLYKAIEEELKAGRKVIISLPSGPNFWHIYVLDRQTESGDFVAYSRGYNNNNILEMNNIKALIRAINGTDILTYLPADEKLMPDQTKKGSK